LSNRLARLVHYKAHTRRPSLRSVARATAADAHYVADALATYAQDGRNLASSHAANVDRQRMLAACNTFANDYGLKFTP
jgi:hypothetical protein